MTHKYFFWIENDSIEIYKNGKIQKYKGEEKFALSNGIENFWETWKENSAFISDDMVCFAFLGKDKSIIENIKKYCEDFKINENESFTFGDLKLVLSNKKLNKFSLSFNEKEFYYQKTEYSYNKIPREADLEKIYVVGNISIKDILLSEQIDVQTEEYETSKNIKNKSKVVSFFESKMNNYKK